MIKSSTEARFLFNLCIALTHVKFYMDLNYIKNRHYIWDTLYLTPRAIGRLCLLIVCIYCFPKKIY